MHQIDLLELKTRKQIYDFIHKYPGIHLREIIRKLDLSEGTIRYHLKYLEKNEVINKKIEDGYSRFYATNSVSSVNKKILQLMRKQVPRNIMLYLLVSTYASQKNLSDELIKTPSTIKFHLKKLIKMEIIEEATQEKGFVFTTYKNVKKMRYKPQGREIVYMLKDPYLIYDLFVTYKNKLFDNGTTKEVLDWLDWITRTGEKPYRLKDKKKYAKDVEDLLYELFPLPFR
jgi:DNA-binding transcriptional ArsR family regulator